MRLQDTAVGRENVYHWTRPALPPPSGGDYVAFSIQTHTINTAVRVEVVQNLIAANGTIIS